MYHIQVFNLSRSKVFALPSEYCDWTEACMEGQQYIFNRKEENNEALFFRVVEDCDFIPEEEEKEETEPSNGVCFADPEELTCSVDCDQCPDAWECDDAFYMDRKSSVADKTDPYKNCLLTQEMLNEINRHFNSAYSIQFNRD